VTVKVRLPAGVEPRLGSYVRVEIPVASAEALAVPVEALVERAGRRGVFVAEGGAARFREVVLGLDDGRVAEVRSGVREGEAVIVTGLHRLEDGIPVEVTVRP
jgi:multidrug efflux pump subunit AcrA (membrane-fusion protein)